MDDDLIQRLLLAESDFLDALQSGPHMLASYRQTLSPLLDGLAIAREVGNIGTETLSLAHSIASRISELASCFLDLKRCEELTRAELLRDFDAMHQQMANLNLNEPRKSLLQDNPSASPFPSIHFSTPVRDAETSYPPFLVPAYQWLLHNLHNPYPAIEIKTQIAVSSSSQVSSINSWFANARRRIGWTTLCRERFSNCRADMIDAAYRALVEEDAQRPLSPELRHCFVTIKVAADGLYSSTFTRSAFAGDLDDILKDVKEGESSGRESVKVEKCHQVQQLNPIEVRRDRSLLKVSHNGKEFAGCSRSSSTDESEEEENIVPLILAGSKRRRSSIEPVEQLPGAIRAMKRLRASAKSQTHLPSPPLSTDGIDAPPDDDLLEPVPVLPIQPRINEVLPSPNPRPPEANAADISRHPSDSVVIPNLHTISGPLPRPNTEYEYPIDNWLHADFDDLFTIPPPVDAAEPDFTINWEVELFKDYRIPGNIECPTTVTADIYVSASTDMSNIDGFLQSIGGPTFAAPLGSGPPSDTVGAPYTVPFDSSVSDFSQTIDWTSLPNGRDRDVYQPTVYSTSPQFSFDPQSLPEIDLSMLQLPQSIPAVGCQRDVVSKQAKLNRLYAMQEEVRRMEQELQLQGVVM